MRTSNLHTNRYFRISFLRDYNLFPSSDLLLSLERKYGDSLSRDDLYGVKPKKKPEADPVVAVEEEKTEFSPIKGGMTGTMGTFDTAALGTEEP